MYKLDLFLESSLTINTYYCSKTLVQRDVFTICSIFHSVVVFYLNTKLVCVCRKQNLLLLSDWSVIATGKALLQRKSDYETNHLGSPFHSPSVMNPES